MTYAERLANFEQATGLRPVANVVHRALDSEQLGNDGEADGVIGTEVSCFLLDDVQGLIKGTKDVVEGSCSAVHIAKVLSTPTCGKGQSDSPCTNYQPSPLASSQGTFGR